MLPRVRILFSNGALALPSLKDDGVLGILTTGAPVAGTFVLSTPYKLTKYDDLLINLGITDVNNPGICKLIKEFYDQQTTEGTEVWLMGVADTVSLADMADITETYGKAFIQGAKKLRGLIFSRTPAIGYTPTVTAGIDADSYTALTNAQALCEWATDTYKSPMFAIIEGRSYTGVAASLTDLRTLSNNRAGIFIGDTVSGAGSCIGVLAGRIAAGGVQRNVGRVRSGKLNISAGFIGTTDVSLADVTGVHDKGFIALRNHIGRDGYFFTDDPLATSLTDDYNSIMRRRVVDKAYRIAYNTLQDELLDDIPVTNAGTLTPTYAKSVETLVVNDIVSRMTNNGELGNDPSDQDDKGVKCFVDYTQNIVSTGAWNVVLKIKPKGCNKYIDVLLGFLAISSES
jgi:hypothetical protein